tara:strand:- start:8863 stop:9945 length:1083 start_codon:yes stop_codon:yes gene_type:complete
VQTVQNINDIKYFIHQWDIIDDSFSYDVWWRPTKIKVNYTTMPTFVADFSNCSVNSLPVLVTEDRKIITNHVWPLISKYRNKPHKVHDVFTEWGEQVHINMPPIRQQFHGTWKYVWLPIDEYSAENPWHIWIDVISKFRLIEKRWSTNFEKYVFILSNPSKYFEKVCKVFFPELKYLVIPKNETWRFSHLIVPSMSNYNDGILSPNMPGWLRYLANLVIPEETEPKNKIVITRKDAKNRNIKNQQDLLLALKGWKTVTLENLTIEEQVKTFATASHIVSPHGAGLTNCLWMRPGTKVYELTHKAFYGKKVYPVLSHCLGLEHHVVLCDAEKIQTSKPKNKKAKDMVDLKIDIPKLLKILD